MSREKWVTTQVSPGICSYDTEATIDKLIRKLIALEERVERLEDPDKYSYYYNPVQWWDREEDDSV